MGEVLATELVTHRTIGGRAWDLVFHSWLGFSLRPSWLTETPEDSGSSLQLPELEAPPPGLGVHGYQRETVLSHPTEDNPFLCLG